MADEQQSLGAVYQKYQREEGDIPESEDSDDNSALGISFVVHIQSRSYGSETCIGCHRDNDQHADFKNEDIETAGVRFNYKQN
jgi:hypothetical protein